MRIRECAQRAWHYLVDVSAFKRLVLALAVAQALTLALTVWLYLEQRGAVVANHRASITSCDTTNVLRAYLLVRAREVDSPLELRARRDLIVRDCAIRDGVYAAHPAARRALLERVAAGDPRWGIHDGRLVRREIHFGPAP